MGIKNEQRNGSGFKTVLREQLNKRSLFDQVIHAIIGCSCDAKPADSGNNYALGLVYTAHAIVDLVDKWI
jgi:hypothetical protein